MWPDVFLSQQDTRMYLQSSDAPPCCFQDFWHGASTETLGLEGKEMILGSPFTKFMGLQTTYVAFPRVLLTLSACRSFLVLGCRLTCDWTRRCWLEEFPLWDVALVAGSWRFGLACVCVCVWLWMHSGRDPPGCICGLQGAQADSWRQALAVDRTPG